MTSNRRRRIGRHLLVALLAAVATVGTFAVSGPAAGSETGQPSERRAGSHQIFGTITGRATLDGRPNDEYVVGLFRFDPDSGKWFRYGRIPGVDDVHDYVTHVYRDGRFEAVGVQPGRYKAVVVGRGRPLTAPQWVGAGPAWTASGKNVLKHVSGTTLTVRAGDTTRSGTTDLHEVGYVRLGESFDANGNRVGTDALISQGLNRKRGIWASIPGSGRLPVEPGTHPVRYHPSAEDATSTANVDVPPSQTTDVSFDYPATLFFDIDVVDSEPPEDDPTPSFGATVYAYQVDDDQLQLSYQWLRDGEPIAGATDPDYQSVPKDVGHVLVVRVTADAPGYPQRSQRSDAQPLPVTRSKMTELDVTDHHVRYGHEDDTDVLAKVILANGERPRGKVTFFAHRDGNGISTLGAATVNRDGIARMQLPRWSQPNLKARFVPSDPRQATVSGAEDKDDLHVRSPHPDTRLRLERSTISSGHRLWIKTAVVGPARMIDLDDFVTTVKIDGHLEDRLDVGPVHVVRLARLDPGKHRIRVSYEPTHPYRYVVRPATRTVTVTR